MTSRTGRWLLLVLALAAAGCPPPAPPPPPTPPPPPPLAQADAVVVEKGKRLLTLLRNEIVLRQYHVALGRNPEGPKREAGDGRTPEGRYVIDWRNPDSHYHRSLHVSYPDQLAARQAEEAGVQPGGDIMIHGWPNGMETAGAANLATDWTEGCIAVTNDEMDELWALIPDGTPIEIRP